MMILLTVFLFICACFGAKVEINSATRPTESLSMSVGGAFVNGGSPLPDGVNAPDLFQSATAELGSPPPMTKHTFMEEIEAIEEKLRTNATLCEDEIKTWKGVQAEMQNALGTDYCTQFQTPTGANAVCCYVQATGTNYGLCSFLSIVNANVTFTPNMPSCPADSPFASVNATTSVRTGMNSIRQVIHLDLFGEICEDVDELNLCYVYVSEKKHSCLKFAANTNIVMLRQCCDAANTDSPFCQASDMECF